jgi:hypothetical protein
MTASGCRTRHAHFYLSINTHHPISSALAKLGVQ